MYKYLKFYITPLLFAVLLPLVFLGGAWLWFPVVAITLIMVIGDAINGDDYGTPEYKYPKLLNIPLYLTLPVCLVGLAILAWYSQSGNDDFLKIGTFIQSLTGIDVFQARANSKWYHLIGGAISIGFLTGGYGINVGHELTHRTWDKMAWIWGRWILATANTTDFSLEHVYGHHETVGTMVDPATARRGENVYKFIVRSWWGSNKNA